MLKIRKQACAETDLIEIWLYSYEKWGEAQAERYFDELERAIQQLGRNPELGQRCDHIREGFRLLRVNRHVVYYVVAPRFVRIVRVLHERMEPSRNL